MTALELTAVALVHAGACTAAVAIMHLIGRGEIALALVIAAIAGAQAAALLYHRREPAPAGALVKLHAGLALGGAALVAGAVLHLQLGLVEHPEVTLPIAALGSLGFPFVLFETMRKAMASRR